MQIEREVRQRDKHCVYCGILMFESTPEDGSRKAVATWEHIINNASIVSLENIARCCASCNSSKGTKQLSLWLESSYCKRRGISRNTVADVVRKALELAVNREMKAEHELSVCNDFLDFYNRKNNTQYAILRHGCQGRLNEPDCICSCGLNVEIAGVYYNDTYARLGWQLAKREIAIQHANHSQRMYPNPDELACVFLEKEWKEKEQKMAKGKYSYTGRVLLLINARNTAFTEFKDYVEYFNGRTSATSHFSEVWLRAFIGGRNESSFLKIFPNGIGDVHS